MRLDQPTISSHRVNICSEPVRPPERKPRLCTNGVEASPAIARLAPASAAAWVSNWCESEQPAPIHEAYFNYIQTFWDHGELDPQIKELIRMRSAMNADCKQ